ncbi:putative DNA-binding domain-containing protein [Labrys sp. LIt4]|uniref:HvfC/BufC N-terminal domain-containing protein n=1 Tax=Labrys sp. LIt4 TaxID=2821355 RepID=UPI001ADEF330|nr:DNA-binding domain-containing protein [Labrys sp. LIt4]MBP0579552.1 putative DNA-binding domain-containing protein [Labrys sp. LIt4]
MLADTQSSFRLAVLDPAAALPAGLAAHNGVAPHRRFAVYRDNVALGLAAALESRFPASIAIVGADFFRALAIGFARQHPPRSPLLLDYGDDLPAFTETFEPAREVPYLPDVMRLEIARAQAYHAADAEPAPPSALTALDPARLHEVRVETHPAMRLLRSAFPVATIWQMNAGGEAREITDWSGEDVLVTRPHLDVEVQILPPGGHAFLATLLAGQPLEAAAEAAFAETPDFNLAAAIAGLVAAGIACRFQI